MHRSTLTRISYYKRWVRVSELQLYGVYRSTDNDTHPGVVEGIIDALGERASSYVAATAAGSSGSGVVNGTGGSDRERSDDSAAGSGHSCDTAAGGARSNDSTTGSSSSQDCSRRSEGGSCTSEGVRLRQGRASGSAHVASGAGPADRGPTSHLGGRRDASGTDAQPVPSLQQSAAAASITEASASVHSQGRDLSHGLGRGLPQAGSEGQHLSPEQLLASQGYRVMYRGLSPVEWSQLRASMAAGLAEEKSEAYAGADGFPPAPLP